MSGIYAAIRLDAEAGGPEPPRDAFVRMTEALLSHDAMLEARSRHARDGAELGLVTPSGSPLVHRLVEHEESGGTLLYLGDGRVDESTLRHVAGSQDYAALSGFFTLLRVQRRGRDHPTGAARCTLVRDRSGSFAMVFRVVDDVLYVAPRITALHLVPPSLNDLDPLGLGFLLSSGFIPGAATQFRSIRSVEAGSALSVDGRGIRATNRYWRFPPSLKEGDADDAELLDRAVSGFEAAVAANYDDTRHTTVFLSGGVDSRAIVAACVAQAERVGAVHTASWGASGSEDVVGTDAYVAREIARKLGTRHRFLPKLCTDYRQDFGTACRMTDWLSDVPSAHPVEWRLMGALADMGFRRCLRGDQVFTGFRPVYSAEDAKSVATMYRLSRQRLAGQLLQADVHRHWSEATEDFLAGLDEPEGYSANDLRDLYRFENDVPKMLQSASMYKALYMDNRYPILDDHFLRILPSTRSEDRSRKRLFNRITARVAGELSEIPFADRHSDPDARSFFVEGGIARTYLMDSLEDASSPVFDLFDREALRRLASEVASASLKPELEGSYRKKVKKAAVDTLFRLHPRAASAIGHRSRASSLPWDKAIRRFLVIKHFMDAHFGR